MNEQQDNQGASTYKGAGVDIDAGNQLIDRIKPLVAATKRTGADGKIGGFGGIFDLAACGYDDPVLVAANDGVGTKLKLAFAMDQHHTVGIDLVAMCVNDLVVQGAEPLFFLDYFATGGLDITVAEQVIRGIADGCKQAGCALTGGETAEMPGMYQKDHYDLAGFAVGAVERGQILPRNDIAAGDVVLGLASSGLHSNGFSLVRHIMDKNKITYNDAAPFAEGKSIGEMLLTPTRIYVKPCLEAIKTGYVKALAHITGGGFVDNIPRVLPQDLAVKIDCTAWSYPQVFAWLQTQGNISTDEMLHTFNCGIGMVLMVGKDEAQPVIDILTDAGETVSVIGEVVPRVEDTVCFDNQESLV